MAKFVKCVAANGEEILLNINAVKKILRYDRTERADVLEDFDGNMYDCKCCIEGCEYDDAQRCIVEI